MSKMVLRAIVLSTVGIGLHAQGASALTVVVGPASCQATIKPHYATIQAAVDAVSGGSTIYVCPGTYPEQVTVSKPLTIKGVNDNNHGAAVITVPAGGLVPNVTTASYGVVAAQLLIQNATPVSIQNLMIDGTGGGCPTSNGYDHVAGIELLNVGDAVSGATVKKIVVRNLTSSCSLGVGLHAENTGIVLDSSNFHYIDGVAVYQTGGDGQIINNTIQTTSNGIVLHGVTQQSNVSTNTIMSSGLSGVTLEAGTSLATVQKNNIGPFVNFGILLSESPGNTVSSNKVTNSWNGLLLYYAGGTTAWANTFTNIGYIGIWDEYSTGGNAVNSNTITESPIGIVTVSPADDDLSGNTLVNVETLSL
jgi:parallel beta-helix repeat protein